MRMVICDIFLKSAEAGLLLQDKKGSMPAGKNGPWRSQDTPLRNTSHWLITFLKSYELTKENKFRRAGKKASDFLLESELEGGFFKCRKNHKDSANGLVGQAWVIEALAFASDCFGKVYWRKARDVFLNHSFSSRAGLWYSANKNLNRTFNQQLMFAASGLLLTRSFYDKEIKKRCDCFFRNMRKSIDTYHNGLVFHNIRPSMKTGGLRDYLIYCRNKIFNKKTLQLSLGYNSFNLYILSALKNSFPGVAGNFWKSGKFRNILKFSASPVYLRKIASNPYSYPYNPAGFELGLAARTFLKKEKLADMLIKKQIKEHYSFEKKLMCRNTSDPETLSARIYELARFPDLEFL
jgi:hypothetical protein